MGASVQFLFLWHVSYPFIYFFTFLVTSSHQKFLITSSVIFHYPSCSPTGILWYSWVTSALNFLSLGTYTFLFLNINLSTSLYSSSLSIFIPTCFISSTAFITSLSFTCHDLAKHLSHYLYFLFFSRLTTQERSAGKISHDHRSQVTVHSHITDNVT